MTFRCPPKLKIALRSSYSAGAGGAYGALMNLYHAGFNPAHIDYHQMGQTALGGAIVAMVFHWLRPPNECAKPADVQGDNGLH